MQIGIGTYSFSGLEGFFGLGPSLPEIFTKIKDLGFNSVELIEKDLMSNDIEDIKKWLEEAGLNITSVHALPSKEVIERLATLGGSVVICPSAAFNNAAEAKEVADGLCQLSDFAEENGIKIAYHNHNDEFYFTEGKTLLEHLADANDKLYLQLDCGWCTAAGSYAPSFIRKYKNRVLSIHVKENNRVIGPGPLPKSKYDAAGNPFAGLDLEKMTIEEKKAIVENIKAAMAGGDDRHQTSMQCKLGDASSNIDYKEVKAALDEQDIEAFWVIERENFYDDHDKCLAEDCAWVKENIK